MSARARMPEPAYGYEPLASDIEATWQADGEQVDVDCAGVVVSARRPQGRCATSDGRAVEATIRDGRGFYKIVETIAPPM